MSPERVRVLVVSRHPVVRIGVAQLLGRRAGLDPRACSVADAVGEVRDGAGAVVVYDVQDVRYQGLSALDTLLRRPELRVLVLSHGQDHDLVALALRRGADGCVSIAASSDQLGAAVEAVARGGVLHLPPDEGHGISAREREVLALIAAGYSNRDIAATLFVSANTVKTHIRRAYARIGVHRRSQAVAWCLAHGLGQGTGRD